ncbi:MAG: NAD(P)-dependent oxidoreductase [Rhodospirillales bacterium]|nr:NAD(P)-dependent oxidoreductase [Rhodospirillales bacterium]
MHTIGFIGSGVMGASMAGHLLDAGYELHITNRTRDKARRLVERGAIWHDTPSELAPCSEVICTMVGFPADVEAVYFGADGILAAAKPGSLLVDFTTSRPDLAVRIAAAASARGLRALDAPVSGGDRGAREATLSIMAGGTPEAFEAAGPVLDRLGRQRILHGPAGSGQHCKMCNQIAIAGTMIGVCESLAYARQAKLDPARVLESIATGAAGSWSLTHLAPRMLAGDDQPGFYVKHFVKDLGIALEAAQAMKLELPGLALALRLYRELSEAGAAECGTQALIRRWEAPAVRQAT